MRGRKRTDKACSEYMEGRSDKKKEYGGRRSRGFRLGDAGWNDDLILFNSQVQSLPYCPDSKNSDWRAERTTKSKMHCVVEVIK